jgi:DNA-binding IclR family transcriptional regulator
MTSTPIYDTTRPAEIPARAGRVTPPRRAVRRGGGTSHAERVFRVQQAFAELGGGPQGLAELSRAAGIDDSAVHRILRSGVAHGTFQQVGRGRYRLGPQAAMLGLGALERAVSDDALRGILERLRLSIDGSLVFLYGLSSFAGMQRQCIEMAVGTSDLSELGFGPRELVFSHRSLRIGASGRAILAHLPESVQRRVAAEPVPAGMGPGAFHDSHRMLASLAEIRAHGYALGLEECVAGWDSIAVPVFWGGLVVGAVTVIAPGALTPTERAPLIAATRKAAQEVRRLVALDD